MPRAALPAQPSCLQLREHPAIELLGLAARDRQRLPVRALQVLGEQQDLIGVAGVVRDLAADRLVDRVRLAADVSPSAAGRRRSSGVSASNTHCQPCSHSASSSRAALRAAPRTPDRACDPAFRRRWSGSRSSAIACCRPCAASAPRRCWPRDRSSTCSCSSDSCAIDLSASFLIFCSSSMATSRIGERQSDMFDDQQARRRPRPGPRPARRPRARGPRRRAAPRAG